MRERPDTTPTRFADKARMAQAWREISARIPKEEAAPSHGTGQICLFQDARAAALTEHPDQVIGPPPWRSRTPFLEAEVRSAGKGGNRPVNQVHRVQGDEQPKYDLPKRQDYEASKKRARACWREKTRQTDWDCAALNLEVYKY